MYINKEFILKLLIILASLLFFFNTFANVSNELVTVRASYLFGIDEERDLMSVYDAFVTDSGKTLKVSLLSKTIEKTCVDWYWYDYRGEETDCDDCIDSGDDFCFCIVGHCDNNRTGKRTIKTKKYKK
jgi:hypothetical protein